MTGTFTTPTPAGIPASSNTPGDDDLAELDGEEEVEGDLEDDDEPEDDTTPVNEGSNQLTLAIGGPKPLTSVLKLLPWQRDFGSTEQFKRGDVIEARVTIRIRDIHIDGKGKKERVTRTHRGVIESVDFD